MIPQRSREALAKPPTSSRVAVRPSLLARGLAVSRRGSNEEAFEGFSGGEESEGCVGSFVEFFGDGGQVGLVVGGHGALG
jgi:hypothetical protein